MSSTIQTQKSVSEILVEIELERLEALSTNDFEAIVEERIPQLVEALRDSVKILHECGSAMRLPSKFDETHIASILNPPPASVQDGTEKL